MVTYLSLYVGSRSRGDGGLDDLHVDTHISSDAGLHITRRDNAISIEVHPFAEPLHVAHARRDRLVHRFVQVYNHVGDLGRPHGRAVVFVVQLEQLLAEETDVFFPVQRRSEISRADRRV